MRGDVTGYVDDSSIDNNTAAEDGGGVYASFYGMRQLGGTIRDNHAGGSGGGVYVDNASSLTAGMMYDNTASQQGDDLYNNSGLQSLYPQQGDRRYGDGNSGDLRTVQTQAIPGYYPASPGLPLHRLEHREGRQRQDLCKRRCPDDEQESSALCPVGEGRLADDAGHPRHAEPAGRPDDAKRNACGHGSI